MPAHSSHARTMQSSRGRQPNASLGGLHRESTDKVNHAQTSVPSSRRFITGSATSSESSYVSSSSGSSFPNPSGRHSAENAQKAIMKADKCMRYLKKLDRKDKDYWDKQAASAADARSASSSASTGSGVFAEMTRPSIGSAGAKANSEKLVEGLLTELENTALDILGALKLMMWFVPQMEDGKRAEEFSYSQYSQQVRTLLREVSEDTRLDKQSDFLSHLQRKIATEGRRGYSLILKAWPKLMKDLVEMQEVVETLRQARSYKTKLNWAYLTEAGTLLARKRAHVEAIEKCEDIWQVLNELP